ncbi:MAG: phage pre-tape measure protein [bacterium]
MSLKDIVHSSTRVEFPGGDFEVFGLTLEDISSLIADHQEAMIELFGGKEPKWAEVLTKFPDFAAAMIALAANEPEEQDSVRRLPVGVQLVALEAVWKETAIDMDTVGKLLSNIIKGLDNLNKRWETVPDLIPGKKDSN